MAATQLQLGIIGAGRIGKMHTETIARQVPELTIKAVADPDIDGAWAQGMGIAVIASDADCIFDDPEIDTVAIFASTPVQVDLIEMALASKKHVFCEKPVAFDDAVIDDLAARTSRAGVRVMVGLNRRFDPSYRQVRETVARGDIGTPHIVRITNRDPKRPDPAYARSSGGLFLDFTVHDFDMARFVTGSEITQVYAAGAALLDDASHDTPALAVDTIDTAVITVRFACGALGVIDNSREAVYGYDQRLEVFGSHGSVEAGNVTPTTAIVRSRDGARSDNPWRNFQTRYRQSYVAELQAFARCLQTDQDVPVGLKDVAKAVRAARAAGRSVAEKRPVEL